MLSKGDFHKVDFEAVGASAFWSDSKVFTCVSLVLAPAQLDDCLSSVLFAPLEAEQTFHSFCWRRQDGLTLGKQSAPWSAILQFICNAHRFFICNSS
jgi:hypothetical protein